jgi:hypothetical protein
MWTVLYIYMWNILKDCNAPSSEPFRRDFDRCREMYFYRDLEV